MLGEDALHVAAEVGGPQPGGQPEHGALNGAAHAVLLIFGLQNGLAHLLPLGVVQHREGLGRHGLQCAGVLQGGVGDAVDGADVGAHPHAPQGQRLLGHRTGGHQGGGEAAGEVSAAPVVLAPLALDEAGIVPMAGPGGVADGLIVLGVLVGVANEHGQRRAGGLALEYAGEHLHRVALPAGGSGGVLAGLPPVQLPLNGLQIQLQAGGDALQHHADGRAVGLAENHVSHVGSLPLLSQVLCRDAPASGRVWTPAPAVFIRTRPDALRSRVGAALVAARGRGQAPPLHHSCKNGSVAARPSYVRAI